MSRTPSVVRAAVVRMPRLALLLLALLGFGAHAQPPGDAFRLQDHLGRHWRNEVVTFDASKAALRGAKSGYALVDREDRPYAYQLLSGGRTIAFATDLAPFETREYRFAPRTALPASDISVEENADQIRIGNSRIGISINKRLASGAGPVAAIRLRSGRSVGGSRLRTSQPVSYSAAVTARGPVLAEVLCQARVGGQVRWELRLRVHAKEPVILIDETFALGDGAAFDLDLTRGFDADTLFYRYGRSAPDDANSTGRVATWKIRADRDPVFVWEPWLHWWENERQGPWFALFGEREADMLAIGAREAGVWIDPAQGAAARADAQIPLVQARDSLRLSLPLKAGARKWMIGAHDKDASLEQMKRGLAKHAPLPQQYLIKHGDFPLDRVKGYTLEWPGDETGRPRLLVLAKDVSRLRARVTVEARKIGQLLQAPPSQYDIEDRVSLFLATGNAELGKLLAATAARWIQDSVDMFLTRDELTTIGFAPHHQIRILNAINIADAVWSTEHVPAALRARLKAQLAFLGYTVNREDYWSPPRGYAANPNMTSTVAAFQTAIGCMIREHPLAAEWVANGMKELKENQLDRWSDDNGGWLEAPHYAMLSYDYLLGAFLMSYNAGFNEHVFHPKMRKVIEWLAKISTPPDATGLNRRYLPPIGNTYMREPSGEFGIVAALWKERDPVFASEMQWMHKQHGAFGAAGVGGFFPMMTGYRQLLVDSTIAEKPPRYSSELFPRTGVVLRNAYPSERETQLHLIAGSNHAHYDRDSGSISLWGKGRLVANDFGYYGEAPGDDHSMLVSASAKDAQIMHVAHFAPGEEIDYVRGIKNDAWERRIVFVKGAPLEPNYFVVTDTLKPSEPATWRLWLNADKVSAVRQSAVAHGKEDVDTDVFFLRPADVALTTESRTRDTQGTVAGKYGRISTTQIGLTVRAPAGAPVAAVVYPRLRGEQPPQFESIADGKGVRVRTAVGIDYVFSSASPFTYAADGIRFEGTVGAVRMRAEGPRLWLGDAGSVSARGKSLQRGKSAPLRH